MTTNYTDGVYIDGYDHGYLDAIKDVIEGLDKLAATVKSEAATAALEELKGVINTIGDADGNALYPPAGV